MGKKNNDKLEILFVCTGNTCRSPMAEGILKKMLKEMGVEEVKVSSAGIGSWENSPASPFAIEVAKLRGVDISGHRSHRLTRKMMEEADLILIMSFEHLNYIKRIDEEAHGKAYLLKAFPEPNISSNADLSRGVLSIKDPIGGSFEDYVHSFQEIEKEVKRIFPELLSLVKKE